MGQTVTQLGDMQYGAAAGSSNRVGKGTAPGPHALTYDGGRAESLSYDAAGNVAKLGGQSFFWDFEDRLAKAETSDAVSESRYDFTGRRVIHKVTNKADGTSTVTLYPFEEFEIRPYDEPVKYVFTGKTRVARVTTSISHRPRVQRLRLRLGWNLATFSVSATNVSAQLAPFGIEAGGVIQYLGETSGYTNVPPGVGLPAGAIVWIESPSSQVVSLVGQYSEPSPKLFSGAGYVGNPTMRLWVPEILGLTNGDIWLFEPERQIWLPPPVPSTNGAAPGLVGIRPGEAFYASTAAPDELIWPEDPRGVLYYHEDHLGSSAVLTDRYGNILEESTYFPFGLQRTHVSKDGKQEPYGFAQKERDPETGLNYFEARYQHPVYGRFISVDPKLSLEPAASLGGPQGLNYYAYCANNPLAFIDPNGENFLGDAYDSVKASVSETVADVKQSVREVAEAGSWEPDKTSRGRYEVMVGIWFGDKDVVSAFVENHVVIDRVTDNGVQKPTQLYDKLIAGFIALDGRFVKTWPIHQWGGTQPTSTDNPMAYESKTSVKTRHDSITKQLPAATGIGLGGVRGSKVKAGVDYKLLGKEPSIDSKGRISADFGVGLTGGGEFSVAAGNLELSGKLYGTATVRLVKQKNIISIVVTGTGYVEVQGKVMFPQTANMLQIPVRISGEGTLNRVYRFDVDKVQKLKGL
jgi:RHS repeat-associated protein